MANERPNSGRREEREEGSRTERRVLSKFSSPTTSSIYLSKEEERDKEGENGKALFLSFSRAAAVDFDS